MGCSNQDRFMDLLADIHRVNIDSLEDYLRDETDFYEAPASTRFHGAYGGGLVEHSLAVYDNLRGLYGIYKDAITPIPFESLIIAGLLHDVCKANFYKSGTRNVKDANGIWQTVQTYIIDDQLPLGHGEKSVIILQQFINLTPDEIYAIRWHMGGFDDAGRSYAGGQSLSAAMSKCPLLVLLHMADLAANFITKV